ncbi:hypothetical protein NOF04DRAFT_1312031 [Fusarium oxysporum II5]|nr:hypothetical protein NOF04DRAFT_1312031 [Fusarium oxysporum II5]
MRAHSLYHPLSWSVLMLNCMTVPPRTTTLPLPSCRPLVISCIGRQAQSNHFWLYYELLSIATEVSRAELVPGCQKKLIEEASKLGLGYLNGKKEPKSYPAQAIQRSCVPEIVFPHFYPFR